MKKRRRKICRQKFIKKVTKHNGLIRKKNSRFNKKKVKTSHTFEHTLQSKLCAV